MEVCIIAMIFEDGKYRYKVKSKEGNIFYESHDMKCKKDLYPDLERTLKKMSFKKQKWDFKRRDNVSE